MHLGGSNPDITPQLGINDTIRVVKRVFRVMPWENCKEKDDHKLFIYREEDDNSQNHQNGTVYVEGKSSQRV